MKHVVLLALGVLVLAGCSSGTGRAPTYPVSGTVTMKKQPLAGATVVFVPVEGASQEAAMGVTDASGKFKLTTFSADDGAQEGNYRIKVLKFDSSKATKQEVLTYEQEQKMQFGDERPTPPAKNTLPKKYESEATSGLTHTVAKAASTLDIAIE
jgi:PBP1b-binding outer membrane lipoprotein LpoB